MDQIERKEAVCSQKRKEEIEKILKSIPKLKYIPEESTIIDIGCGSGEGIETLRKHFPKASIYGVDNIADFVAEAQDRNLNMENNIICSDALEFIKDEEQIKNESIDLITIFQATHPLPLDEIIQSSRRILTKDGIVIVTGWEELPDYEGFEQNRVEIKDVSGFENYVYVLQKGLRS